jgi:hypothetical protein
VGSGRFVNGVLDPVRRDIEAGTDSESAAPVKTEDEI